METIGSIDINNKFGLKIIFNIASLNIKIIYLASN